MQIGISQIHCSTGIVGQPKQSQEGVGNQSWPRSARKISVDGQTMQWCATCWHTNTVPPFCAQLLQMASMDGTVTGCVVGPLANPLRSRTPFSNMLAIFVTTYGHCCCVAPRWAYLDCLIVCGTHDRTRSSALLTRSWRHDLGRQLLSHLCLDQIDFVRAIAACPNNNEGHINSAEGRQGERLADERGIDLRDYTWRGAQSEEIGRMCKRYCQKCHVR